MIKDTIGLYKSWKQPLDGVQTTTYLAVPLIFPKYFEKSVYSQLIKNIPQLVQDVPASVFLVKYNLDKVDYVAKGMFWGPCIL